MLKKYNCMFPPSFAIPQIKNYFSKSKINSHRRRGGKEAQLGLLEFWWWCRTGDPMTPSHLSVTTATIFSNLEHYSQRLEGSTRHMPIFYDDWRKRSCTLWPCGLRVKASSNKEVAVWAKPGSQKVQAQPAIKWLLWVFYIGLYSPSLSRIFCCLQTKSPSDIFSGASSRGSHVDWPRELLRSLFCKSLTFAEEAMQCVDSSFCNSQAMIFVLLFCFVLFLTAALPFPFYAAFWICLQW